MTEWQLQQTMNNTATCSRGRYSVPHFFKNAEVHASLRSSKDSITRRYSLTLLTHVRFSALVRNGGQLFNHLFDPCSEHFLVVPPFPGTYQYLTATKSLVVRLSSWLLPKMATSAPTAASVDDDALMGTTSSSTLHVNHLVAIYGYPAIRLVVALIIVYIASGVSSYVIYNKIS